MSGRLVNTAHRSHEGHERRKLGTAKGFLRPALSVHWGEMMNRLALRHILCPMDLSPLSMNSLEWANAIARARRAELRALHVVVTEGLVAPDSLGSLERSEIGRAHV